MDVIDYFRDEIKKYYPDSEELLLSSRFDNQLRFNFYFKIKTDCPHLLYLNWDGEGRYFTIKCLEFSDAALLTQLASDYTEKGSRVFNVGLPKSTLSFLYQGKDKLIGTEFKNTNQFEFDPGNMSGQEVMQCVDPEFV